MEGLSELFTPKFTVMAKVSSRHLLSPPRACFEIIDFQLIMASHAIFKIKVRSLLSESTYYDMIEPYDIFRRNQWCAPFMLPTTLNSSLVQLGIPARLDCESFDPEIVRTRALLSGSTSSTV
ncbi:hypothetical protein J6590_011699 [Homalodisca vitripennis]|nr:hypothetical protein J6590_011699 [Homalodisca vitripennis]